MRELQGKKLAVILGGGCRRAFGYFEVIGPRFWALWMECGCCTESIVHNPIVFSYRVVDLILFLTHQPCHYPHFSVLFQHGHLQPFSMAIARRSLLNWESVSDRLLTARFGFRLKSIAILLWYAPKETSDVMASHTQWSIPEEHSGKKLIASYDGANFHVLHWDEISEEV